MPVAELQERIDAAEFAEWLAYARVQPFGEAHNDRRFGTIAAAIVNLFRKRGSKPRQWFHYFPPYERKHGERDWRGMLAVAASLNQRFGGVDKRTTPPEM